MRWGRRRDSAERRVPDDATPRAVIDGWADDLSSALGPDWVWSSSAHELRRKRGSLTDRITIKSGMWDNPGAPIRAGLGWSLSDREFGAWRRQHANDVVGEGTDVVHLTAGRLTGSTSGERRDLRAPGALDALGREVLDVIVPWFDSGLDTPSSVSAPPVPAFWFMASKVEWLTFRARPAEVDDLVVRLFAEQPGTFPAMHKAVVSAEAGERTFGYTTRACWPLVRFGAVASHGGDLILRDGTVLRRPPHERPTPGLVSTRPGMAVFTTVPGQSTGDIPWPMIERDLRTWGEDATADLVAAGLPESTRTAIGDRTAYLTSTPNPDRSDGSGLPYDRATALAAVEVIEGKPRALARKRRRSSA